MGSKTAKDGGFKKGHSEDYAVTRLNTRGLTFFAVPASEMPTWQLYLETPPGSSGPKGSNAIGASTIHWSSRPQFGRIPFRVQKKASFSDKIQ